MRCAIVHYWLLGMRGGEKVVEELCRILPNPDIFTLFYDPQQVSPFIRSHRIRASFLNPLRRHYRSLLPAMPFALEHFDLRGYDLVVSSESGPAKGVLTSSDTKHVCYCHTPMRYLWDLYSAYVHDWTRSKLKRALLAGFSNYLRMWDVNAAMRVDEFVANSQNVRNRIWKAYRRPAQVIHPPVTMDHLYNRPSGDYFLIVSELVAYKRVADAVRYCTRTGKQLKIVGRGPDYPVLKRMAGRSVEFCGRVAQDELADLYAHSRALMLPGEEDFGIVAVEALASGKPVIALGRGGVLESVPLANPRAGFFYTEPLDRGLERAVEAFEREEKHISPATLRLYASRFSRQAFARKMAKVLFDPGPREVDSEHVQVRVRA